MRIESIVSLDISYGGMAGCGLPLNLVDGGVARWDRALFWTAEKQTVSLAARRILARDVRTFVARVQALIGPIRGVWVENVPHSGHRIVDLAKLHGHIEIELGDMGLEMQQANQSSARKFVLGRGRPPDGSSATEKKAWITEPLKLAGAPVANHNEADALVGGLFALSECAVPTLCQLLGPPPPAKARAKRASSGAAVGA